MSFHFVGIDHVQLAGPPQCEETARRFYGEILGWVELPKPEHLRRRGGLWFQCGAQQVHIGIQKDFTPATKAHPAFYVRDIQALREHVIKNGLDPIEDEPLPGADRFYLTDPFGNRLEFLEWL
ncbi:Glyoxalase/bleomycin resistance protein/dioxygenase [Sulfobacillus acidophilus TPY]|uniref:Glyoxalase/bleomycin resistance protein/dioxygenase n=1 Tax=Sulfobacillus acidophilus (strain ATCC 700253 / DSM 10332 / NAL) TaxID=679936 RepID=G8TV40_SULAD|nr:Glyoxalase/bleomycin resistance protein/dioxygenase [Sulfobacillus acidophilus TPY]AEW03621.1 Glyoxalase/bleomycin resistance protein/dioxygenase [Sulfobacillus acidophilus DSM 10332]